MDIITKHRTSANVDSEFYDKICDVSKQYCLSKDKIFKDLLKITIKNINYRLNTESLTEYQDHSPERWETLYFPIYPDEFELFSNTRYKFRISISKIAFIGFLFFWNLLISSYSERLKKPGINLSSYRIFRLRFRSHIFYYISKFNLKQIE